MKEKNQTHWAMLEIAEQGAPGNTIDLWSRIEARVTSVSAGRTQKKITHRWKGRIAFGLAFILLLIGLIACVPEARAFAEDVIQRIGIALVDTNRFDQNTQVMKVEATEISNPSLSLSVDEVRKQIGFSLLLPTWLPDDLSYIHRSITEYDPQSWEGSGKQLTIEYGRTANFDSASGLLFLHANDGPIGAPPLLAESREQPVTVNRQPGIYMHGGWRDDGKGDPNTKMGILQWDDQADDAYLTWTQEGVTYLLEAHNLSLNLEDLQQIAMSMTEK
jgi:hypothetical protein